MDRREFLRFAVGSAFLPLAGSKPVAADSKVDLNNKFISLTGKNVGVTFCPSIGDTLPALYFFDKSKGTAHNDDKSISVDLWASTANDSRKEVNCLLAELKAANPQSITLVEDKISENPHKLAPFEKFIKQILEHELSTDKRQVLRALSKQV